MAGGGAKDSRWLQLEVCRQFVRDKCTRSPSECKYAHPPPTIDTTGGTVTACFDFLRKRCQRENCRYYHPPEHLVNQLVTTGGSFSSSGASSDLYYDKLGTMPRQDKTDRLEICRNFRNGRCRMEQCKYAHPPEHIQVNDYESTVTVCMDFMKDRCDRSQCRYFHPPQHLQAKVRQSQASAGPGAATSAQLMEQILLTSQRKRPASTPADVLSEAYMPRQMQFQHGGVASPAAAAAAAAMAAAASATPQYPAAPAYDMYAAQNPVMMASILQSLAATGGQTADPAAQYAQYAAAQASAQATAQAAALAASAAMAQAGSQYGWPSMSPSAAALSASAAAASNPYTNAAAAESMFNPAALTAASLAAASTSASGGMRQSSSSGNTMTVCMDFKAGKCTRMSCKYAHPGDHVAVDNKTVNICRDFQRGKCQRSTCRYYHPL